MNRFKKAWAEIKESHRKLKAQTEADEQAIKDWVDSCNRREQFDSEPMPQKLYEAYQGFGLIRQIRVGAYAMKAYKRIIKCGQ